jgi:hypothetical protein
MEAHNKALPLKREELGPYLEMKQELMARLALHLDVLGKRGAAKTRRFPERFRDK